jgi:hypothetical protein
MKRVKIRMAKYSELFSCFPLPWGNGCSCLSHVCASQNCRLKKSFNHCAAALCSFGKQLLANTCCRHITVEKFSKKSNGQHKDLFHVIHELECCEWQDYSQIQLWRSKHSIRNHQIALIFLHRYFLTTVHKQHFVQYPLVLNAEHCPLFSACTWFSKQSKYLMLATGKKEIWGNK